MHNEVRDVVLTENGALWAAFAWGLQERLANNTENTYMPGSNNLRAADFVQLFALPGGDIIAASKNGTLVRKNKGSNNFETISTSFVERKRPLLQGLGKRAGNILILPFEGALAFFDSEQKRSIITITQIGTSSLEEYEIKRIETKGDSIWVDLGSFVWKRHINWIKIYGDYRLADPNSWELASESLPESDKKPDYVSSFLNFPLERAKTISLISGGNAVAWGWVKNGGDYYFSKMQNEQWGAAFLANQTGYGDDHEDNWSFSSKSLSMLPNGDFAVGMWGPGVITYNSLGEKNNWFHSSNSCLTEHSNNAGGWTFALGLVPAPDYSGFVFSYLSEGKYGLGFAKNNNAACNKSADASSPVAFAVAARQSETVDGWEIYAAWRYSRDSRDGGIDFYLTSPDNFSPALQKKWPVSFGSPIDFAFDSKGVLWAVSQSKIFYLDKQDDEWKEPSYIRGFSDAVISALETDAQNGLWISTLGNGAYSFSQRSPDSLIAKQYKINDGLLNETIYDIAIDTIKGRVYFAHNLGLSVFSTHLVRGTADYMQSGARKPIAFPNPFYPGLHAYITIDFISEKSSVYILDSSGKRVRLFRGADLRGGAVMWDGKNESGKLVAPGLYHFVAADGKNTAKGKIIIQR